MLRYLFIAAMLKYVFIAFTRKERFCWGI